MALAELRHELKDGRVYRRSDLAHWSNAVDRHVRMLVDEGELVKISGGLYMKPRRTAFGDVSARPEEVVGAFLSDDQYLMFSPNDYNALGVGTTQLYNESYVYNHKRHGRFKLAGKSYYFRHDRKFPKKLSESFLLVDLLNNLKTLPEDKDLVIEQVKKRVREKDNRSFRQALELYGTVRTQKQFSDLMAA